MGDAFPWRRKRKAEQKQLVSRRHEFLEGDAGAGGAPASPFVPPAVKGPLWCCWPEGYVGEGYQGSVLLNVELV